MAYGIILVLDPTQDGTRHGWQVFISRTIRFLKIFTLRVYCYYYVVKSRTLPNRSKTQNKASLNFITINIETLKGDTPSLTPSLQGLRINFSIRRPRNTSFP